VTAIDHRAERDRSYSVARRLHDGPSPMRVALRRDVVLHAPHRVAPEGTTVTVDSVVNAGDRGQEIWFTHDGGRFCVSAGAVDPA
jgi:hypothetical protein